MQFWFESLTLLSLNGAFKCGAFKGNSFEFKNLLGSLLLTKWYCLKSNLAVLHFQKAVLAKLVCVPQAWYKNNHPDALSSMCAMQLQISPNCTVCREMRRSMRLPFPNYSPISIPPLFLSYCWCYFPLHVFQPLLSASTDKNNSWQGCDNTWRIQ